MTAVKFSSFMVNDKSEPLTLANMFTHYAAFGGITKTDTNMLATAFTSGIWVGDVGGGAQVVTNNNKIERIATNAATKLIHSSLQPPISFSFSFYAFENDWGMRFRSNNTDDEYFKVKLVSGTNYTLNIYKATGGVETLITAKQWDTNNRPVSTPHKVTIAVRDEQGVTDDTKRQIGISVWFNDELVLAGGTIVSTVYGQYMVAEVVPGSTIHTVMDFLSISYLCEIIPVSSLDPGEVPMTAIQRALEDRYIKWWSRYNSSLYVYYPVARSSALTLASTSEYQLERQRDTRQLFSHIRVMGALQWVQLKDDTLIALIGHRFKEFNSPSPWTRDDCFRIGTSLFVRAKEQADRAQMMLTGLPFMEPEDRLVVPIADSAGTGDFIIDGLKWATNPDGSLALTLALRGYNY